METIAINDKQNTEKKALMVKIPCKNNLGTEHVMPRKMKTPIEKDE